MTNALISGLMQDTILPALQEDFDYPNKKAAASVLKDLKRAILKIKVEDFYSEE